MRTMNMIQLAVLSATLLLLSTVNSAPDLSRLEEVVDIADRNEVKSLIQILKHLLYGNKKKNKKHDKETVADHPVGTGGRMDSAIIQDPHIRVKRQTGILTNTANQINTTQKDTTNMTEEPGGLNIILDFMNDMLGSGEVTNTSSTEAIQVLPTEPEPTHPEKAFTYKISHYTEDQPQDAVNEWVKKGLDVWSDDRANEYLSSHGCPTLKFTQTTGDDQDFEINFDYEVFNRYRLEQISFWWTKEKSIMINDNWNLYPGYIAHCVAYDVCEALGCRCYWYGQGDDIMKCGVSEWSDYNRHEAQPNDLKTLGIALGCIDPWEYEKDFPRPQPKIP